MGTVSVTAPELNKLLENILLYADKKALHLREVLFVIYSSKIQMFSCDEYVAVTDTLDFDSGDAVGREFALSIVNAEKLLEWVKKDKKVVHKSVIKITFLKTLVKFESPDFDGEIRLDYEEPAWDRWNAVMNLLDESHEPEMIPTYSVNPDRFAKLARLKSDKEAPVVFRAIRPYGTMVLQFKKGVNLRGVVMPIDDAYVQEEFLWTKKDHTEVSPNSTSTESAENSIDFPT